MEVPLVRRIHVGWATYAAAACLAVGFGMGRFTNTPKRLHHPVGSEHVVWAYGGDTDWPPWSPMSKHHWNVTVYTLNEKPYRAWYGRIDYCETWLPAKQGFGECPKGHRTPPHWVTVR